MAMIKCEECGKEISDKAAACPHCGCVVEKKKYCEECGKEISPKAVVCPQCGHAVKVEENAPEQKINNFSLSGMIVSLISLFIDFWGLVSATGLVLSIVGLKNSPSGKSRTLAIVGIVAGGIELIIKFIAIVNLINAGF